MEKQTPIESNSINTVKPVIQSEQQPKQSNFLVILLSVLLLISVSVAGFFAFQTQKLVKELTLLRVEATPIATIVPTTEPLVTNSAQTPKVPESVSNLFDSINKNFKLNLVAVEENKFYSPTGEITKKSWKIDLNSSSLGKSFTSYLLTLLRPLDAESGGIGGGGVDAYENDDIKCFHSYGYRSGDPTSWKDPFNYLSCSEK